MKLDWVVCVLYEMIGMEDVVWEDGDGGFCGFVGSVEGCEDDGEGVIYGIEEGFYEFGVSVWFIWIVYGVRGNWWYRWD